LSRTGPARQGPSLQGPGQGQGQELDLQGLKFGPEGVLKDKDKD